MTATGHRPQRPRPGRYGPDPVAAAWVYRLGDRASTAALHLNQWMNPTRRWLGQPYWSFSSLLESRVKSAVTFINDCEQFVARYTVQQGCSRVICGHIHVPAMRRLAGVDYYNCGDWVEHCTALVEHVDGRIELGRIELVDAAGRGLLGRPRAA